MNRRKLEEIRILIAQINELMRHLNQLLIEDQLPDLPEEIHEILARVERQAVEKTRQDFAAAIRANLRDGTYTLARVIDGDTLVVDPPSEFSGLAIDVHVRLYGVDAPENNTELGPIYTDVLEKLCQLNKGNIHIVWDRERSGTHYGGIPNDNLGRNVGNVFVDIGDGFLLYVNAILASTQDVRIERKNRELIRAARHMRRWHYRHWHHQHRHWPFHVDHPRPLQPDRLLQCLTSLDNPGGLREFIQSDHHLLNPWGLPKDMVLRPMEDSNPSLRMLAEIREVGGCPVCSVVADEIIERWHLLLERENATPFDLLLILAYTSWHQPEPEVSG